MRDALAEFPDLYFRVENRPTDPAEALVVEARSAALLVVGAPGAESGLARLIAVSTALHAALYAKSPVAVVPRAEPAAGGRIVAAVDEPGARDRTLDAAFEEARRRELPLEVVGVKETAAAADLDALERELLAVELRPWCARFPDVAVAPRILHGPVVPTLVDAGGGATILVVGARRRSGFLGLRDASVTPKLLQRAGCPVLVAR